MGALLVRSWIDWMYDTISKSGGGYAVVMIPSPSQTPGQTEDIILLAGQEQDELTA